MNRSPAIDRRFSQLLEDFAAVQEKFWRFGLAQERSDVMSLAVLMSGINMLMKAGASAPIKSETMSLAGELLDQVRIACTPKLELPKVRLPNLEIALEACASSAQPRTWPRTVLALARYAHLGDLAPSEWPAKLDEIEARLAEAETASTRRQAYAAAE